MITVNVDILSLLIFRALKLKLTELCDGNYSQNGSQCS